MEVTKLVEKCFISDLALVPSPEVACGFRYDSNHRVPDIQISVNVNKKLPKLASRPTDMGRIRKITDILALQASSFKSSNVRGGNKGKETLGPFFKHNLVLYHF